jgi:hypothetical protein
MADFQPRGLDFLRDFVAAEHVLVSKEAGSASVQDEQVTIFDLPVGTAPAADGLRPGQPRRRACEFTPMPRLGFP